MIDQATPAAGSGQNNPPDYETKAELARRLGVSERTIANLMGRGLPYLALTGKLRRFPRRAVDDWLASQQVRRA
jgi:excisionase family DNA binding protein